MKVSITVNCGLETRKAIAHHYGLTEPATHKEVHDCLLSLVMYDLESIEDDYERASCEAKGV